MILSRISRALREQNWFAVAIEFVIVVCGVVVALLSLLTRGRGIRPRHELVPISASERALMLTAMVAIAVIHASGLVWVAREISL